MLLGFSVFLHLIVSSMTIIQTEKTEILIPIFLLLTAIVSLLSFGLGTYRTFIKRRQADLEESTPLEEIERQNQPAQEP